ncbi:MAG TPA: hypothetical protein VFK13_08120 [Gemmatimonadaceae bacterium]|nr:hypothetical protein [Gemmatimonadaceae bacterium]
MATFAVNALMAVSLAVLLTFRARNWPDAQSSWWLVRIFAYAPAIAVVLPWFIALMWSRRLRASYESATDVRAHTAAYAVNATLLMAYMAMIAALALL